MQVYERISEHETPVDAVTIAIGGTTEDELEAGLFWPPRVVNGKFYEAGTEVTGDVQTAFMRAQDVARERGFERIVVMLQHDGIWHDGWGKLVESSEPVPLHDLLWNDDILFKD